MVENLSLSALIYLSRLRPTCLVCWESFIISLDILIVGWEMTDRVLRIFHYQPWYTYWNGTPGCSTVENLSLSALIYLSRWTGRGFAVENLSLSALIYLSRSISTTSPGWESFIISLDILKRTFRLRGESLRIFHYQPWYTYGLDGRRGRHVENLSLSALIYLRTALAPAKIRWESFIISLDILTASLFNCGTVLRIFHYQPWYT